MHVTHDVVTRVVTLARARWSSRYIISPYFTTLSRIYYRFRDITRPGSAGYPCIFSQKTLTSKERRGAYHPWPFSPPVRNDLSPRARRILFQRALQNAQLPNPRAGISRMCARKPAPNSFRVGGVAVSITRRYRARVYAWCRVARRKCVPSNVKMQRTTVSSTVKK